MCYFVFNLLSKNPAGGPEFLGIVLDIILIIAATAIFNEIKKELTK